jgi:hypothetical protein
MDRRFLNENRFLRSMVLAARSSVPEVRFARERRTWPL